MPRLLPPAAALFAASSLFSATFGTATGPPGGASYTDIVLDEARTQLYLVNSANDRIDIFSTRTRTLQGSIPVSSQPVAAALGAAVGGSSRYLYVTAYASSLLYQIDLTARNGPAVASRINLP